MAKCKGLNIKGAPCGSDAVEGSKYSSAHQDSPSKKNEKKSKRGLKSVWLSYAKVLIVGLIGFTLFPVAMGLFKIELNLDYWPVLVHLVAGIGAIITLFLTKPERMNLALLAVVLILTPCLFQAGQTYEDIKRKRVIQKNATIKISRSLKSYLSMLHDMIFFSSDGWLPSNDKEFFSEKAAKFYCSNLNIDREAHILPKQSWRILIFSRTNEFKTVLSNALIEYNAYFVPEFIRKLEAVEQSPLMSLYTRTLPLQPTIDKQIGGKVAPTLFLGNEANIVKELKKIEALLYEVQKACQAVDWKIDWDLFNMKTNNRIPMKLLGKDRFDPFKWKPN